MFYCSNKVTCKAIFSNEEADSVKGICNKCGAALADENNIGWAHVDSLRDKPLAPNSVQAKQAAKAKQATSTPQPQTPQPNLTPNPPLTEKQNQLALKKNLTLSQIAAFTKEQRDAFNAEAEKV